MNKSLRIERLNQLKRVLRKQARAIARKQACKLNRVRRKFNMAHWDCKTASCAIGSAGWDPWFRARGLMSIEGHESDGAWDGGNGNVKFKENEMFFAGEAFFGISYTESEYLFDPDHYPLKARDIKPSHVIARVDELIKHYSAKSEPML